MQGQGQRRLSLWSELIWTFVLLVVVMQGPALSAAGPMGTQERVAAQRALDRVAFSHQAIPQGSASSAVSFEKACPVGASQSKVEKALLESKALEVYWQRPITGEQLQAEMDRMVMGSRDTAVLKEMFAALGNDPQAIAENLARPLLADRLCRQWYARDDRFHDDLKSKALIQLNGLTAQTLGSTDGHYTEYELRENTSDRPAGEFGQAGVLDAGQWKKAIAHLAEVLHVANVATPEALPVGRISALQEDDTQFYALTVLEAGAHSVKVGMVEWPKVPFDQWLQSQRGALGGQEPAATSTAYRLAPVPEAGTGANDTWSPMTTVPQERQHHLAVWTGTEMIVWGGVAGGDFTHPTNTGGRYNPATDSWTLTSTTGAPAGRQDPCGVWTGTRMLVWGGAVYLSYPTSGGQYDPVTDTWSTMASPGSVAPGRADNSTVWTGTEMIIWGGTDTSGLVPSGALNTGAAYNPSTDTWRALSAPKITIPPDPFLYPFEGRFGHACVWTGSRMIVWGGGDNGTTYADGESYDPSTDTWTQIKSSGAGSFYSSAVWTGTQMVIWGGEAFSGSPSNSGLIYNPLTDTWGATTFTGAPAARTRQFGWWSATQSVMIIWGGKDSSGSLTSGGRYSPGTDTWQAVSTVSAPAAHLYSASVWTGTEMIMWGGNWAGIVGGRYNPATDLWVPTNFYNIPTSRREFEAVWTGTEMLVWGGDRMGGGIPYNGPGGRYNPATDAWTIMSTVNAPPPRFRFPAVWTGAAMVVWGGQVDQFGNSTNTGGVYNPATDIWAPTSMLGAPSTRGSATIIWTGTEVIAWGGLDASGLGLATGGRYNPTTDTWVATSTVGATGQGAHTAVWTGTEMIVWGGKDATGTFTNVGQRYNPATDTWSSATLTGAPDARLLHSAVWTGSRMIIWGGSSAPVQLGASYDPSLDAWTPISNPASGFRTSNAVVWTGHELVLWGGTDTINDLNSGLRYRPSADVWTSTSLAGAPSPRSCPGVWTGSAMLVWSGAASGTGSPPEPPWNGGRYWMSSNPIVTGVSPSVGTAAGGTSVTITGTMLAGATSVTFGGIPAASYVVNSDTKITAVTPAHAVGTVDVVVTTPDGTSAITPADQYTYTSIPNMVFQSDTFTDSCVAAGAGNLDGVIDPGEDITLNVTLSNIGTGGATNVQALLTTATPGVSISTSTAAYPNIPMGGTGASLTPYAFHVAVSHTCGDVLAFTLQITSNEGSWSSNLTLPVGKNGPPPTAVAFSENFDSTPGVMPAGWTTETVAGPTWGAYTGTAVCSGTGDIKYTTSGSGCDAWIYTPGQALTAGTTYTVSFSERTNSATKQHNLYVWVGTTPNHAGMTTQLSGGGYKNTVCATRTGTAFTVPTSGTYYIGFHEYLSGTLSSLFVDDVTITYPGIPPCVDNPCIVLPNPKEASRAGTPMTASAGAATAVNVTYTAACGAMDHTIYWGQGLITTSLAWTNSACALGVTGTATFDPGAPAPGGWFYFVMVGQNGVNEGSYGFDSLGAERPSAAGTVGTCNHPQNLAGTCP